MPIIKPTAAGLYDFLGGQIDEDALQMKCHFSTVHPAVTGIFSVFCEPQTTITTYGEGGKYRADLYLYLSRCRYPGNEDTDEPNFPEWGRIVVEVDGHEFHEKTKQQASYDKKRDREFNLDGYRVIRFTGSDVFNDPMLCAEHVFYHIDDFAREILFDYIDRGKLEELIVGGEIRRR